MTIEKTLQMCCFRLKALDESGSQLSSVPTPSLGKSFALAGQFDRCFHNPYPRRMLHPTASEMIVVSCIEANTEVNDGPAA